MASKIVAVKSGKAEASIEIKNVHLWDGLVDPYLYTAQAKLENGDTIKEKVWLSNLFL